MCTGLRAHDMAVRLKYAGVAVDQLVPSISSALDLAVARARDGLDVALFCTYTATLEARGLLQDKGLVAPFWEE